MTSNLLVSFCPDCGVDQFVVDIIPKGLVFLAHKREEGEENWRTCPGSDRWPDPTDIRPFIPEVAP